MAKIAGLEDTSLQAILDGGLTIANLMDSATEFAALFAPSVLFRSCSVLAVVLCGESQAAATSCCSWKSLHASCHASCCSWKLCSAACRTSHFFTDTTSTIESGYMSTCDRWACGQALLIVGIFRWSSGKEVQNMDVHIPAQTTAASDH